MGTDAVDLKPHPGRRHVAVGLTLKVVPFVLLRPGVAEPCTSAELPGAIKETKNRARQLLARPQCRLAFTLLRIIGLLLFCRQSRVRSTSNPNLAKLSVPRPATVSATNLVKSKSKSSVSRHFTGKSFVKLKRWKRRQSYSFARILKNFSL